MSREVKSAPIQLAYKARDPCKSLTPDTQLPSFFIMGLWVGRASADLCSLGKRSFPVSLGQQGLFVLFIHVTLDLLSPISKLLFTTSVSWDQYVPYFLFITNFSGALWCFGWKLSPIGPWIWTGCGIMTRWSFASLRQALRIRHPHYSLLPLSGWDQPGSCSCSHAFSNFCHEFWYFEIVSLSVISCFSRGVYFTTEKKQKQKQ